MQFTLGGLTLATNADWQTLGPTSSLGLGEMERETEQIK